MLNDETLTKIADQVRTVQATKAAVGGAATRVATVAFMFAEVQAGAALAGFINGRFQSAGKDHLAIAGVPADLAAGLLGAGAAVFGFFGPALDTHVAALSAGMAASYTYRTALSYGASARDKSREDALAAEAEAAAKLAPKLNARQLAAAKSAAAMTPYVMPAQQPAPMPSNVIRFDHNAQAPQAPQAAAQADAPAAVATV